MATLGMLFLLGFLVLAGLLVGVLLSSGRRTGEVSAPAHLGATAQTMRARGNARVLLAAAVAGGVGVGALFAGSAAGWGMATPAAAALAAAGAGSVAVGAVDPRGSDPAPIRSAELTPRTFQGFGPRWAFAIPSVLAAALVVLLLATGLTSSTSEDGQGDSLTWAVTDQVSGSVSPYPGWHTGLPLLVLVAAAAAAYLFALHRVAAWPRPAEPDLYGFDDEVRRAATRMLLFSASGALLTATGAAAFVAARAWHAVTANLRMNTEFLPTGQSATVGPWTLTGDSPIEQAIDAVVAVAALAIPLGITFMLASLAAGWVRQPRLIDAPVAHR